MDAFASFCYSIPMILNASDRLYRRYNQILSKLHREAMADRCKGDIFIGWDWPTLAMVKPREYAELISIKRDFRILRSAGLTPPK